MVVQLVQSLNLFLWVMWGGGGGSITVENMRFQFSIKLKIYDGVSYK